MKIILFASSVLLLLCAAYCSINNKFPKPDKQIEKKLVFHKVTNRPLSRYFKISLDSASLGEIVRTQYLAQTKFANDTIENFLIKLGLCNNDMSEQVYIPCGSAFETIIKVNDTHQNYDTIIGTTNHLPMYYGYPHEDDSSIYTEIFTKNVNTGLYSNSQAILYALIGYYIDGFGNKAIVVHSEVLHFRQNNHFKEYLKNALVLYKWQNGKYVPDSLLTIDGELIPKEQYPQAYEKYMGDSDY